jgi:hypothetical protein
MTWGDKSPSSAYLETLARLQRQPKVGSDDPVRDQPPGPRRSRVGDAPTGVVACPSCGTEYRPART